MPPKKQSSANAQRRTADRSKQDIEDQIAAVFTRRFGAQASTFLALLRREFGSLTTLTPAAVERVAALWARVIAVNPAATRNQLAGMFLETLRRGGADLRNDLARSAGVDPRNRRQMSRFLRAIGGSVFNVPQTQALAYYDQYAGRLISGVDSRTRDAIVAIVRNALSHGTPYTSVEAALKQRFAIMGEGRGKGRSRARLIATYETGTAYEGSKSATAARLERAGIRMRQRWIDVGDDRVDPDCRANAAVGWIPEGATFPSGVTRPLDHPG